MKLLLQEFKKFSRQNWWVYIIFLICLFLIYFTDSGNILEVSLVFMFHFLGDLCIMMMWDYYAKNQEKMALRAQLGSFIVFCFIWIYTGLTAEKWSYLIPQLLFCWPLVKWYFPNIKFVNWKFTTFVWALIFVLYFSLSLITNIWVLIQILWFMIFPIALVLNNDKIKYFLSLVWISFIFIGSATFLYDWFISKNVIWTDLSYTLLPLTVVVFYLKNIRKYME